jgi:hypothetical protein
MQTQDIADIENQASYAAATAPNSVSVSQDYTSPLVVAELAPDIHAIVQEAILRTRGRELIKGIQAKTLPK